MHQMIAEHNSIQTLYAALAATLF